MDKDLLNKLETLRVKYLQLKHRYIDCYNIYRMGKLEQKMNAISNEMYDILIKLTKNNDDALIKLKDFQLGLIDNFDLN